MVLTTAIELPAPARVGSGLLAAARPLPRGWERGVSFSGSSCVAPQPWPYCIDPDESPGEFTEKTLAELGAPVDFEPIGIYQAIQCTTMSAGSSEQTASETLDATQDWLLGRELADGAVTGNPNLSTAALVATADSGYAAALATIEQAIADGLYGRLGFVHVTFGDLAMLVGAQVVWRDGRVWRTPAGNLVVASPGYDFTGELHATGEVFASVSSKETRHDVDRSVNRSEAYAEEIGLAAFDPCFNVYTTVTPEG